MKNILTSLALLQTLAISLSAQSTFERHFGTPSKLDAFSAIAPTPAGGYLLAGTTANFGSAGLDIFLVKTDADGNTLWTKTWGGPGNDGAAALMQIAGGGYLLAGHTAGANGDRDFLALRLDENGEEVWRVVRGGLDDDAATHLLTLSNGDFIVSGSIDPTLLPGPDVFVTRIATNGSVIWENSLGISGLSKGTVETSDGGFILANNFGSLRKFDAQGNFIWEKTVVVPAVPAVVPSIEFIQRDLAGQIIVGGGNNYTSQPFFATLNESGDLESNFNIPQDDVSFIGQGLADAKRLSNGQYALMFKDINTPTAAFFRPGLAVFDPVADTVLWRATYEELGLADIWQPGQLMKMEVGDDLLLVGSTSSVEEGVNAFLSKCSDSGTPLWHKTFGVTALADNESARKVLQTSDGGYLVLANKAVGGNSFDMWLIKTDANGNAQWDVAYGFPDADNVASLDMAPDGGYIAAGFNGATIRVLKVNENGQLQWLKKFDVGLADGTFGMRVSPDNECLLVFPAYIVDTFVNVGSTLMKLDAQGDSVWAKHYTDLGGGYTQPSFYGLAFAPNNRFALCGGVQVPPIDDLWPVVALTDADGNLLWSKTHDPDDLLAILIDIHTASGNGFVTHGIRIEEQDFSVRPHVIRTNSDGNLLWTSKPDDQDATFLFPWTSAHQLNSAHTFLFEQKRLAELGSVGAVQKLEAFGQLVCEGDFGFGRTASFRGGAATSDGGAVAVGEATFDNSTDAWLVKMNPDCTVGFKTPLKPPFEMQLSPNPSPGDLILDIESEQTGAVAVEVFNAAGQSVLRWHGEKTGETLRQTFDLSRAADGFYFVWVQIGGKARALGWLKQ